MKVVVIIPAGGTSAASLGIVPKQHSSGGKDRYLGISKRGNGYIRCMLINGARSALKQCANKKDKLSVWLQQLIIRRGFNKAAVALANKNARILLVPHAGMGNGKEKRHLCSSSYDFSSLGYSPSML